LEFYGTNQNGCDETSNAPLRALQVRVTNAIRAIDKNHLIFIEGNCWNNYDGMFPLWDENMALSFHKYGIKTMWLRYKMLDYRTQYSVIGGWEKVEKTLMFGLSHFFDGIK
jgi:hypothetical protein